jgi:hypothetical protein
MSLTTPESIQKLQTALHAKAELPQVAKQSFREWYLENRSDDANVQEQS